jgi:RNA polymerase sigma-70 factor (ECF subfamily)
VQFRDLVLRYQNGVYSLFQRLIGDEAISRQLTEETFIFVSTNLHRLTDPEAFSFFLYASALEFLERYYESKVARQRQSIWSTAGSDIPAAAEESPRRDELAVRRFQRVISALETSSRQAFVLCGLERLGYDEAGEVLGVEAAAVRSSLHHARSFICEYLFMEDDEAKDDA